MFSSYIKTNCSRSSSSLSIYLLYSLCFIYIFSLLCIARLLFFLWIYSSLELVTVYDILTALGIGLRFDARLTALLTLPLLLFLCIPYLRHRLARYKNIVAIVYFLIFCIIFALYALDAGFFAYLGERLNSKIVDLMKDTKESIGMVWESYPFLRISLGVFVISALGALPLRYLFSYTIVFPQRKYISIGIFFIVCIGFLFAIWGRIGSNFYPLRWSNAYFTTNPYITALALNPIQNLYDTYDFIESKGFDTGKAQEAYPLITQLLDIENPDREKLHYARYSAGSPSIAQKPNIIIIIMESLSYSKTSFASGGYNITPSLYKIAEESVLFTHFFANARTTARGIFSTMTGIPDVSESKTASRDQRLANQRIIANEFTGYEKLYLIGGSMAWANIRGFLGGNIDGLRIFEESYWNAPDIDVWGISDYDLFMEANEIFSSLSTPFLAVIQTASFHKPYTIPKGIPQFTKERLSPLVQELYGFESEDEYNSLRFVDYALGEFIAKAKHSPYYKNTIFVILGDHGVTSHGTNVTKSYSNAQLQAWHVPLIIHAPSLLQAGIRHDSASQADVFPTVASLAGIAYTNWTMGTNLFRNTVQEEKGAFISGSKNEALRYILDGYCFYDNKHGKTALYKLDDISGKDYKEDNHALFTLMQERAWALQHTAQYMIFNNKKLNKK